MKLVEMSVTLLVATLVISLIGCSGGSDLEIQTTRAGAEEDSLNQQDSVIAVDSSEASTVVVQEPAEFRKKREPASHWGWIKHEWINVRERPTTKSEIVTKLYRNDRVKLVEHAGNWWLVELEDGTEAYIYSPLVFQERYVDPWTSFKNGCRRADTALSIVEAVNRYSDDDDNAAYITVADNWYDYSGERREKVAAAAYSYWLDCLENNGHETKGASLIIRDDIGKEIVKVSGSAQNPNYHYFD